MVVPLDSAFDAERGYGLPAPAADRHDAMAIDEPADRVDRRHGRRRRRRAAFAPPASAPASKPNNGLDLALHRVRHARAGGRRLHHEPRAGCAGRRVAGASRALGRRSRAPLSSTAAARTPAPAMTGMQAARDMAAETARLLKCPADQVLVASTGVIGVALPIEKIRAACRCRFARSAADQGAAAARAIMTTDPFPKEAAARAPDRLHATVAIGGMAKGSGMIEPMLATMLGVRHDRCRGAAAAARSRAARRGQRQLQRDHRRRRVLDQRLRDAARQRRERRGGRRDGPMPRSSPGCADVCRELALGIVRGGEGATKLVTVVVTGAASAADARRAAKAIANSLLVKTAIHGGDPNWGRLIAVAGRAGVAFDLVARRGGDRIDRAVQGRAAVRRGRARSGSVSAGEGHRRLGRSRRRARRRRPCGPAI